MSKSIPLKIKIKQHDYSINNELNYSDRLPHPPGVLHPIISNREFLVLGIQKNGLDENRKNLHFQSMVSLINREAYPLIKVIANEENEVYQYLCVQSFEKLEFSKPLSENEIQYTFGPALFGLHVLRNFCRSNNNFTYGLITHRALVNTSEGILLANVLVMNNTENSQAEDEIWYLAPEKLSDNCKDNLLADLWSLGILLFRLVQGLYPSSPDEYRSLFGQNKASDSKKLEALINSTVQKVKKEYQEFLSCLLSTKPEDRKIVFDVLDEHNSTDLRYIIGKVAEKLAVKKFEEGVDSFDDLEDENETNQPPQQEGSKLGSDQNQEISQNDPGNPNQAGSQIQKSAENTQNPADQVQESEEHKAEIKENGTANEEPKKPNLASEPENKISPILSTDDWKRISKFLLEEFRTLKEKYTSKNDSDQPGFSINSSVASECPEHILEFTEFCLESACPELTIYIETKYVLMQLANLTFSLEIENHDISSSRNSDSNMKFLQNLRFAIAKAETETFKAVREGEDKEFNDLKEILKTCKSKNELFEIRRDIRKVLKKELIERKNYNINNKTDSSLEKARVFLRTLYFFSFNEIIENTLSIVEVRKSLQSDMGGIRSEIQKISSKYV